MAFASATLFRFQPSQNLSSRTGQASWRSTSLGTVSVGWSRSRTFPSLTTHRFRISCTAQPETVQKVCEIVRKQLALPAESELTPESKFSALGADSLDTVEIVFGLEEEFGINVEEDSAQNITVQEAADLIEKLIQERAPLNSYMNPSKGIIET